MIDQVEAVPAMQDSTGKETALALGSAAALFFLYTFTILALNTYTPALPPLLWIVVSCLSTVGYILIIVYAVRLLVRLTMTARRESLFLLISVVAFISLNPLVWQAIALLHKGTPFWEVFAALTSADNNTLLGVIAPFFLILTGVFFGRLVARLIRETSLLVPVAIVAGLVDFWGVYWGFVNQMSESAPAAVSGLGSAPTAVAAVPPAVTEHMTGTLAFLVHLTPPESIGLGDFVFVALLLACAYRLGFSASRVMWGIFTGLLLASVVMALNEQTLFGHDINISYLPGLVFICGGFLLFNLRTWKLTRQEWLMTGLIVLIFGACISYSIVMSEKAQSAAEPVKYSLSAMTAQEAITQALDRAGKDRRGMEIVPVAMACTYSLEKKDPQLARWDMLVLVRPRQATLKNTRECEIIGGMIPGKGWQVVQSPLTEPKNALEILAKSIKGDETTRLRTAKSLLPTAWTTLAHADEYAKLAKGQKILIIQLAPEGGAVIDAHRKLVKRLKY